MLQWIMGCIFVFFQAEDGIRDYKVTGVQTCALPIYPAGHKGPDIGIDLGVAESLALSDGNRFRLPVASKEEERRNGMLARRVSRCQAGSRRHAVAKRRLLRFRRTI